MSILLQKDMVQILSEACRNEEVNVDNVADADIMKFLSDELTYLDSMEDEIEYTEEMVNVIMQESTYGSRYIVEFDNLSKLMESTGMDAKEALSSVCEHNDISLGDTYILIESVESILETVKKLSKGDLKSKADLKDTVKTIQDLKDKGIKILTKQSKTKKKKRK